MIPKADVKKKIRKGRARNEHTEKEERYRGKDSERQEGGERGKGSEREDREMDSQGQRDKEMKVKID